MYRFELLKQLTGIIILLPALHCMAMAQGGGPANSRAEYEKKYKWRIAQEYLDGVYIPRDLTDAFIHLGKLIEPEDRAKFKGAPEDVVASRLQPTLGRWIAHNWGFAGGSRLSHYIKSAGVTHPEDMSNFVIVTYHRSLNKKPFEIKQLVAAYKERRKNAMLELSPATKAIMEQNEQVLKKKELEEKKTEGKRNRNNERG